jgi:hypothetical protein
MLCVGIDVRKVPRTDIGCRLTRPQDALKKLAKDAKAKSLYPRRSPSRCQTSM